MNALSRILWFRLGREPLDAWFSRWGCILGGLVICGLAIVALRQHAPSQIEFFLGASAAVAACLLLFLLGGLARQVHLAVCEGNAPWPSRRRELLAHGAGVAVMGLGGLALAIASPEMAGTVTGALLILDVYATIPRQGKFVGEIVECFSHGVGWFAVILKEMPKAVLLARLDEELVCGDLQNGRVRPIPPDLKTLDALKPEAFLARKVGKGTELRFRDRHASYRFWDGEACEHYNSL